MQVTVSICLKWVHFYCYLVMLEFLSTSKIPALFDPQAEPRAELLMLSAPGVRKQQMHHSAMKPSCSDAAPHIERASVNRVSRATNFKLSVYLSLL